MSKLSVRLSAAVVVMGLAAGAWLVTGQVSARGNNAPAAQSTATNHTISVNGHGEVQVPPDMATITVGVQEKGSTAQEALSKAADAATAVINAVEAQGVPASHIQTSDLSVYYDQEHDIYNASHQLSVRLDDVTKAGPVLDAAVGAGANNSWGVNFGLKDQSAAQAQALQAAIVNARSRADAMASKLQVNITGVGSASDVTYSTVPIRYDNAAGVAAPSPAAPTPIQPGQLTVSADANVVYTFTPQ